MSLFLHPSLTPEVIAAAAEAGVSVIKSYPRGVTTNAGCGIEDYRRYDAVFAAMQEHGLILSMHGEVPSDAGRDICVLNAEEHFLVHLRDLHARFPRLRLILEHASCAASVACVRELHDTVAATITPHHLELTIDDWAGRTHHFCKPVAKYARDRAALQAVVAEGHPRFFLGSDSAPHPRSAKETAIACGGIYSSPLLLPYLATTFERLGCLDRLEAFVAGHGAGFYGLPPNAGTVMLERRPQRVPEAYGEVVPFLAGEELAWTVVDQTA